MEVSQHSLLKFGTMAIAILFCGACSTSAQRKQEAISSGIKATIEQKEACYAEAASRPEFEPLSKRMALLGPYTFKQLANQDKPTAAEAKLVVEWREAVQPCRKAWIEGMSKALPEEVSPLTDYFNATDAVFVELSQKKVSWGDALRQLQASASMSRARYSQVSSESRDRLQHQHEFELNQRNQAVQNLAIQHRRSEPVTCNTIGVTTTCY